MTWDVKAQGRRQAVVVIKAYWPQRHTNPSLARPILRRALAQARRCKK